MLFGLLYYFAPNVRQPSFRWITPGGVLGVTLWLLASALFGLFVRYAGDYGATYGTLAGIVVFLLWLWITNLALLFGAEIDAELERTRELQSGIEAEKTLQLPPRDTRNSDKAEEKLEKKVAEGRRLRLEAEAAAEVDDDANGYGQARGDERRGTSDAASSASELEPLPSSRARAGDERRG
jgi:membrane protein